MNKTIDELLHFVEARCIKAEEISDKADNLIEYDLYIGIRQSCADFLRVCVVYSEELVISHCREALKESIESIKPAENFISFYQLGLALGYHEILSVYVYLVELHR